MSNYTLHLTCNTGIGKHSCRNSIVMTVYIVQEMRGRDISGAFEYGDVKTVVPVSEQVTSKTCIGPICRIIEGQLGEFKPMADYLLLSGDPVIIGIACAFVSDVTSGFFRVLKWDRLEERYYPILINLWGTKHE